MQLFKARGIIQVVQHFNEPNAVGRASFALRAQGKGGASFVDERTNLASCFHATRKLHVAGASNADDSLLRRGFVDVGTCGCGRARHVGASSFVCEGKTS